MILSPLPQNEITNPPALTRITCVSYSSMPLQPSMSAYLFPLSSIYGIFGINCCGTLSSFGFCWDPQPSSFCLDFAIFPPRFCIRLAARFINLTGTAV